MKPRPVLRYRNLAASSQIQLTVLLDEIMQWRQEFDAENKIFPEIWRQANQQYEAQVYVNEVKEEEVSPIYHIQNKAITNQIRKQITCHKSDSEDFDAAQDPQFVAQLQQMKCQQLQPQLTKPRDLNANSKPFVSRLASVPEHAADSSSRSSCSISCTEMNLMSYQTSSTLGYLAIPVMLNCVPLSNYTAITQVNQIPEAKYVTASIQAQNVSISSQSVRKNTTKKSTKSKPKATKRVHRMHFKRKFSNHANGNFYVPKDIPTKVMQISMERFVCNKLTYYYLKQSIAMQVNDDYIYVIDCKTGILCIINIDLHFKNGDAMYLIAKQNDIGFIDRIPWCIKHIMSASQIAHEYDIHQLPPSSRDAPYFQRMLNKPPVNISERIIWDTNFKSLPQKEHPDNNFPRIRISEVQLQKCCVRSWKKGIIIPVVVIKGKRQWVEWKKFIDIIDANGRKQEICISLDYKGKTWTIGCMDYYVEGIYYKHKLTGSNHKYCYTQQELMGRITTSLDIQ